MSAFLCHSHMDEELVRGLLALFQEIGISLYVDWRDHTMPETPNIETAKNIQDRILACSSFLFLATAHSKTSRWCPWAIRFANSSERSICVIPTFDGTGTYGNESLQLYPKTDIGSAGGREALALFPVGGATVDGFRKPWPKEASRWTKMYCTKKSI